METTNQFRSRIGYATAKTDKLKDWPKGEQKSCYVSKMSTGRLAIYKGQKHFREKSGYKVYNSIEDLGADFTTELVQEAITF